LLALAGVAGVLALPAAPRAQAAPKKLTIAIWSNYMPDAVLAATMTSRSPGRMSGMAISWTSRSASHCSAHK